MAGLSRILFFSSSLASREMLFCFRESCMVVFGFFFVKTFAMPLDLLETDTEI